MKFITNFLFLIFLIMVFAGLFFLARMGLLGNISKTFGVDRPISLGIEYESLDLALGIKKAGVATEELSQTDSQLISLKYRGSHFVDASFANEEATALLNNGQWRYYPISETQIRFSNNSFEISGFLIPDRLRGYIENTTNSEGFINNFLKLLSISKNNIPFYINANILFTGSEMSLDMKKIVIGELVIPQFLIEDNRKNIDNFIREKTALVEGFSVQSISSSLGELKFRGTLPDVEMIEPIAY